MAGGVSAGRAVQSISWRRTAARVSETVSPSKRRLPVSISKKTTPNAQISARLSTDSPRACSGAMYAAVPRITPSWVPCAAVRVGDCINVGERARSAAEASARAGLHRFGQPEIEDLGLSFTGSLYVLGFEIAVNNSLVVGLFERLRDLESERKALGKGKRPRFEAFGERRTVDELHDERA